MRNTPIVLLFAFITFTKSFHAFVSVGKMAVTSLEARGVSIKMASINDVLKY